MSLVERAAEAIGPWESERRGEREQCVDLLRRIAGNMEHALAVWQEFLGSAPESGDRFTAVLWIGPERARQLQRLHLENKDHARALTELSGIPFKDSLGFSDEIDVVQPYDQLEDAESGSDRARSAIRTMTERKQRIDAALSRLDGKASS